MSLLDVQWKAEDMVRLASGHRSKRKRKVQNESQTLASITYQNYFRLYNKISGMTGTASTESEEFGDIYNLSVLKFRLTCQFLE